MPVALSSLYFVVVLTGIVIRFQHIHAGWVVIKPLPILLLALCAWVYTRAKFGPWVVIGAVSGALGDFCLSQGGSAWFMAGLCSFLAGHVAYCVAFARDLRWTRGRAVAIGTTGFLMFVLVTAVCIQHARDAEYVAIPPLFIYVTVMGVMMALAVLHQSPTWMIAAGGILFVVSDAHIAVNHMLRAGSLALHISGLLTYYLAQYLLVAGTISEARKWKDSRDA